MPDFKLYVILDVDICTAIGGDIIEIARQTILGGADILQLRAKNSAQREILKIGRAIKTLAQKTKVACVLNDRPELIKTTGADGVHLGQEDLALEDARKMLGENKIIGVSAHSVEQARRAEAEGADYVAIGPIFATALKPQAAGLGPEIIAKIKDKVKIPLVAIGGIDLNNLGQVLACGAQRVAVCRAIITAPDARAATEEFRQRLYS